MNNNATYPDNRDKSKEPKRGKTVFVSNKSNLSQAQFGQVRTSKGKAKIKGHEKD